MSIKKYDGQCPGCRPVLIDGETRKRLPEDSWQMQAVRKAWEEAPLEECEAFHKVTCQQSRELEHIAVASKLALRMQKELEAAENQRMSVN